MTNLETALARFPGETVGRMLTAQGTRSSLLGNEGEPPRQSASVRQAWLREMERTQLAGWFQPFAQAEAVPALNTHAGPRPEASRLSAAAPRAASAFPVAYRQLLQPQAGPYERHATEGFPNAAAKATQQELGSGETVRTKAPESAYSRTNAPHEETEAHPGQDHRTEAPHIHPAGAALEPQDGWAKGGKALHSAASKVDPLAHSAGSESRPVPAGVAPSAPPEITPPPMADHPTAAFAAPFEAETVVAAPLRPDGGIPRQQGAGSAAPASRGTARLAAPETQQAPGTRVHAQWSAAGVELWLGMDGAASQVGFQAAALVPSLQRSLREQGQRLVRVVCNGQVVFDGDSPISHLLPATPRFADIVAAPPFAGPSRTNLFSSIFQKGNS
ncbi:hypothetical protein [Paracidovorax konjaci]|uniref:Uncharacterized protein n=1 Tax=Paracidovorax konjaci TaxID=32040 RepID=A0A1I1WE68_9BURK|nr:hypothetical protein [Paracidovorax konjaci]SFD93437.1 hypothetical protein SAMN04489710_10979 [Paracidovorax konjaci]